MPRRVPRTLEKGSVQFVIDYFVYPVSGVLKLWHSLFSNFFSLSASWLLALLFLVLTVRGFIAPLSWMSIKSGRISALMGPEIAAIQERLSVATTQDEVTGLLREQRDVQKKYGYSPAVGCLSALITIPFFLGLYRVVLRMAGDVPLHEVGFLNAQDIESFRATTVNAVSITALAREHLSLTAPILVLAIAVTVINMSITLYRGFLTTQFDQKIPRRLLWFMAGMILFIPWVLWSAATAGPVPVAIVLYWGLAYTFNLVQTLVFELILRRRLPLSDAVHDARRESIKRWRSKEPTDAQKQKAETKALPAEERKALVAERTARRRELEKMKSQARKELRQERRSKSSNPPAAPTAE